MTSYTDAGLPALLSDGESHLVERKRSAADRGAIRRNICAFANDLPGVAKPGAIFIGVEDDGRCADIEVNDTLLRELAQMRSDGNFMPLPSMTVEKKTFDGCDIALILVEPSANPPVRYRGRVWVKVGPTVQLASSDEERRLSERRRTADLPFDMRPAGGAALDDLDADYTQTQYMPRAVAPDILERNRRPVDQQLRSLRLAIGDSPVWGALLGLGQDPQAWLPGAYVQFLRIDGREIIDPIRDRKELTGRLDDVLRRLDELLALNVSVRTEVAAAAREAMRPDYPIAALQQLARNAVMHRSYEATNAPVRLHWYVDRVEIQSPGGLCGQVTPKNFGQGATEYRNPLVAEIMHHPGFAQRFGMGVPLAREALAENGNPAPEFVFEPTGVAVIVRIAT